MFIFECLNTKCTKDCIKKAPAVFDEKVVMKLLVGAVTYKPCILDKKKRTRYSIKEEE